MILQVAATYQSDADEVLVDFRSTEDDGVTTSIADSIVVTLSSQTKNLIGSKSKHFLASIEVDSGYLQAEQNYLLKFRHPRVRADLVVDIEATYGSSTYTKTSAVGEVTGTQATMDLPDNVIYTWDQFDNPEQQGPAIIPNDNAVILAPEIQEYVSIYEFTVPRPVEDFSPLSYSGGGNRLLMSNQTNGFFFQSADSAPWANSGYAFMEAGATNLLPNPFFNNATAGVPNGYQIDSAGAMLTQSVDSDYATANGAKIWSVRLRQNNSLMAFNQAVISTVASVPVTQGLEYSFSLYLKVKPLTSLTKVSKLSLVLKWFANTTELSESVTELSILDHKTLALASAFATAPATANMVQVQVRIGSIDFGDDVQLSIFSPQLELGTFATSRTQGVRLQDAITIPDYNAQNQKIRFEIIPGFDSGDAVVLTEGPLVISFTASSTLKAEILSFGSVEAAVAFTAGDFLDFTVEHTAGDLVKLYLSGNLVAQSALPSFTATPSPLVLKGMGFELLKLSVFNRK